MDEKEVQKILHEIGKIYGIVEPLTSNCSAYKKNLIMNTMKKLGGLLLSNDHKEASL